jgi:hypothetical protein
MCGNEYLSMSDQEWFWSARRALLTNLGLRQQGEENHNCLVELARYDLHKVGKIQFLRQVDAIISDLSPGKSTRDGMIAQLSPAVSENYSSELT